MLTKTNEGYMIMFSGNDVRNHKPDMRTMRKEAARLAVEENNTIAYLVENLGVSKMRSSLEREFGYTKEESEKLVEDFLRKSE